MNVTFDRYRTMGTLGKGGMGVVYLAEETDTGERVALKVMRRDLADDPTVRRRFTREIQAASSVVSPNVVQIRDVGRTDEGDLFYVMDLIEGSDLSKLIHESGRLTAAQVADLLDGIATGLDAIHGVGLVHRDLKPANILLTSEHPARPLVTDFGLARLVAESMDLTDTSQIMGTLDYVSPEQIDKRDVNYSSDIYALGCVVHHALAGVPPFTRDSPAATVAAHLAISPPALAETDRALATVDPVVARALAKTPEKRFHSAGDFAKAFRQALDQDSATEPIVELRKTRSQDSRRRVALALSVTVLILGLAAAGISYLTGDDDTRTSEADPVDVAISANGVGSLEIGMDEAEAEGTLGEDLSVADSDGDGCESASASALPGSDLVFRDDELVRIQSDDNSIQTEAGIGPGSTEDELVDAYGESLQPTDDQDPESEITYYLLADSGSDNNLMFAVEAEQVTSIYAGRMPEILEISSCR